MGIDVVYGVFTCVHVFAYKCDIILVSYHRHLLTIPSLHITPPHHRVLSPLLSLSLREGLSPPLAYTPLSEAWGDHLYYFSTLSFKRSGNYTVSFLLEVTDD